MCKEHCMENDNNIGSGFDNDKSGSNYSIDISDKNTVVCHKCGGAHDKCQSKNNIKERRTTMKIIETILSAALALLTAAKYFIKFLNHLNDLDDLKHQTA